VQHAFGVGEENASRGRKGYVFTGAIKQTIAVFLLQLPDLRADG
jgi:hypothetical protein